MKITLVTPGKFKSAEFKSSVETLVTRATRYTQTRHQELTLSQSAKAPEEEALVKYLNGLTSRSALVVLDECGKTMDSRSFATKLQGWMDQGVTELVVAVGGPHGYSDELKKRAVMSWSLSPMTMAHELAAVVAAEQIYRGLTILRGHPYHND